MTSLLSEATQRRKKRVLVIDEEVPWPANTGKRLRTLNLLTELADEFDVALMVHQNGADSGALEELRRRRIGVIVADSRLAPKRGMRLAVGLLASLAARLPYSVHAHYTRGYGRALGGALDTGSYDLVHCEWTPFAIYLTGPTPPVVVAAHNVEAQLWQRIADTERRPLHRLLFRLQARWMAAFEADAFRRLARATAVSEEDAAVLRRIGCANVTVVPNGVDVDFYRPAPADAAEPGTLVFTGSMDWRANQEAIRWFIAHVHPLFELRQRPYRLFVVGRNPPAWLTDRSQVPAPVIVTGSVDDVRPYVARSTVYVVPLQAGGGSRLKILEAFGMGRPVVSTTVGAEGLLVEPGRHIVLADSPEDFTSAIVNLMDDPARQAALSREARDLVVSTYQWSRIARVQAAVWREAMNDRPKAQP